MYRDAMYETVLSSSSRIRILYKVYSTVMGKPTRARTIVARWRYIPSISYRLAPYACPHRVSTALSIRSDEEGNEINLPTSRPHRIFYSPSSYPQKLLRLRGGDDSPERHDGEADDGDGDGIGN
ncbi:hypothetical protein DY000_02025818 [Brassica cretica]|uniref:Uncharacterized protein n=1 Tax=Brassica cretica TaxID=69181 RepID=A0ABQ7EM25_BRACR|nr:hypothetical protein DY000_02025818 [Brassica cretica]